MQTTPNSRLTGLLAITATLMSTAIVTHAQFTIAPPTPVPPPVIGYYLTDLGAFEGRWTMAYGINNAGQVVGEVAGGHAFRTAPNQPYIPWAGDSLGALGSDQFSRAYAINTHGAAVGDSVPLGGLFVRAFRSPGPGTLLEDLGAPSSTRDVHARGLNDTGWIVGFTRSVNSSLSSAMISFGPNHTQSLVPALATMQGTPAESEALDVNAAAQIVGWKTTANRTFGYMLELRSPYRVVDLVLPRGFSSKAYAINDNGQVVGESQTALGTTHAFLWKDENGNGTQEASETRDLDTLNTATSRARGINNFGKAVGSSGDENILYGNSRAILYLPNGPMVDLNTMIYAGAGWILRVATGINDKDQIVGWMESDQPADAQGRVRHAFRLDPRYGRVIYR